MAIKTFQVSAAVMSFLAALTSVGCDEMDDADPNVEVLHNGERADDDHLDFTPVDEEITFRGLAENGRELNGAVLNGRFLNGRFLNGRFLNGKALGAGGTRVNGAQTSQVNLNGTALSNIQIVNGSLLSAHDGVETKIGAQLANTVFKINFDPLTDGGGDMTFKITNVVQSAVQPDVYFHTVDQLNPDSVFETVCRDGGGLPTQAIALPGTWDPTNAVRQPGVGKFTWACRGAALAKAVEWGYKPWVNAELNEAHQAAMRMIRADYFGNGVTHTTNGNAIDVSDKWGIQLSDTSWPIEAKWGPNGAVCLNTPRKLSWPRNSMPEATALPYCTDNGLVDGTPNTAPGQYGGLLMTRAVPNDNPSAY